RKGTVVSTATEHAATMVTVQSPHREQKGEEEQPRDKAESSLLRRPQLHVPFLALEEILPQPLAASLPSAAEEQAAQAAKDKEKEKHMKSFALRTEEETAIDLIKRVKALLPALNESAIAKAHIDTRYDLRRLLRFL